jgi:phospholipase/lecithinase/hemolysin
MERNAFHRLVIFGDSDSDGGEGSRGYYSRVQGARPAPHNYRGRFCNGPVWPEHLAPMLGIDYKAQDNFAVGGATSGLDNIVRGAGEELANSGILGQVQQFVQFYPQAASGTLVVLWGGAADIYPEGAAVPATIKQALSNIEAALDLLLQAGVQTILLGTVVNQGLIPLFRNGPNAKVLTEMCALLNAGLTELVARRRSMGQPVLLADPAGLVEAIMVQPANYGFVNVIEPCLVDGKICGDPAQYLFWDIHFTAAFQPKLADCFYQTLLHHQQDDLGMRH